MERKFLTAAVTNLVFTVALLVLALLERGVFTFFGYRWVWLKDAPYVWTTLVVFGVAVIALLIADYYHRKLAVAEGR